MRALSRLEREEDGQALLYGAAVVVLIVAFFYLTVDIGQLVLGKIQAQNAADGAAEAAASLKTNVHNTRALAYRAMSGQVYLERLALMEATGHALKEIGAPGKNQRAFDEAYKRAEKHHKKVDKLRKGLIAFNDWVAREGPSLTLKAAQIGYRANLGSLGMADRANLRLPESALSEFGKMENRTIGGVTFPGEALSKAGHAGKSRAVVEPKLAAFGGGFLGYDAASRIKAEAVAGPVEAEPLFGKKTTFEKTYGIHWFTVRLMPIGQDPARRPR